MADPAAPYRAFIAAAERYERLFWAHKASKALSVSKVTDTYERELKDGEHVISHTANGYSPRMRIGWTPSTLPRQTIMSSYERAVLEAQLAAAPSVTPSDVAKARATMAELKRGLKAAKRQLALT